jgi:16S rRNA G966 N2-methylase RsmD
MMMDVIPLLGNCITDLPEKLLPTLKKLKLPHCDVPPASGYYFSCNDRGLILNTPDGETVQPVLSKPVGFTGKQPLLKAMAPARGGTVIDATAGLGGDTLRLAMIASHITAIERHPIVYALLLSALESSPVSLRSLTDKIKAEYGNAIEMIQRLPAVDIVFMDPMFPPKRKQSALPPKAVRILRELVGDDNDEKELLSIARAHAIRRVVVKRPLHAPPLSNDHVALHAGKVVRYEVYLPTGKRI